MPVSSSRKFYWLWSLTWIVLSLVLVPACSKKKKKTTPEKPAAAQTEKNTKDAASGGNGKDGQTPPKNVSVNNSLDGAGTAGDAATGKNAAGGDAGDGQKPAGDDAGNAAKEPPRELTDAEKLAQKVAQAEQLAARKTEDAYGEALRLITEILKQDYANFDAMMVMAVIYYQQENMEKMRSVLEYMQGLYKKRNPPVEPPARWHVLMGKYYLFLAQGAEKKGMNITALGYKAQAEKYFGHPSAASDAEAVFSLGVLLLERGEVNQGVEALEKAEKLGGNGVLRKEWRLPLNLGTGYMLQKKPDAALAKFEYALTLNKSCETCQYNLAMLYASWDEFPNVGNLAEKARAEKLLYHAKAYAEILKKRKDPNRAQQMQVDSWMEEARERMAGKGSK